MTKIKICGIRRIEDIEYVNSSNVDYVGFVFAESKRMVSVEQVQQLKEYLSPGIISIGVFVNAAVEEVIYMINNGIIDIAQLHGDESQKYIEELRKKMKRGKIIKAIRIESKESIRFCEEIEADYLLFDTFSSNKYGGTGKEFDWNIVKEVNKPFFIAGGINSNNLQKVIKLLKPFAVDVSSGVEVDGLKDKDKIVEIVVKIKEL